MKKDVSIFLTHILNCIEAVETFSEGLSKDEFKKDDLKQSAIIRKIEIIGEAIKNLSPSFREKYQEIEWKKITGTRDLLIHQYFGIDLDLIWEIINEKLPTLKKQIQHILKENIK